MNPKSGMSNTAGLQGTTDRPPSLGRPIAVIDVGARAVRLDIAEADAASRPRMLESLQKAISIGRDTFQEGFIEPASIEECVEILRGFVLTAREYGIQSPEQIRAVATSSVREAENRQAFLDRIQIATGIAVEVLEDAEVEHLIYLAIHDLLEQRPSLGQERLLVAEVGGGTTRLLVIENGYVSYSSAYRLGSLRMRETLDAYQTPPERACAVLDQHIQRTVNQMHQTVPAGPMAVLLALAGDTATAMARLLPDWDHRSVARLPMGGSPSLAERIVATSPEDLMREYRLPWQEAETAGQALLAYERIARSFGIEEVLVTDRSMRAGLLLKMASHAGGETRFAEQVAHSAVNLGRKYHFDEAHSMHVAELSVRIFRDMQREHGLGAQAELLLRTAGILHDIGAFVSNASHHKHSMYLIAHSELFGLTREDVVLVSLVARYHRRAAPRPTHPEYATLRRDQQLLVTKLSAILRVADALDRSHLQHVRDVRFSREDRQYVITAAGIENVTLERIALKEKADLFESAYGLSVALRAIGAGGRHG